MIIPDCIDCVYRWLMLKGRESEAREVLRKTSSNLGQDGIEAELEDIRQTLKSGENKNFLQQLKHIFKWRVFKRCDSKGF